MEKDLTPRCPYCKEMLQKLPQRKTKCQSCAKPIFVKGTPNDRVKRLMTEAEANEADVLWQAHGEHNQFVKTLQSLGLSEADLSKESNRISPLKSEKEAFLTLLERVANKGEDMHHRKMAAGAAMWEACKARNDYHPYLIAHHKYQLLEIAACGPTNVHRVRIVASGPGGKACTACHAASGLALNLADELKNQTLPHSGCQCPGYWPDQTGVCRCYYEIVFDDELNQEKEGISHNEE